MSADRVVRWLVSSLLLAGIFLALAATAPLSWLHPLGGLLRRPNDVTPERIVRYRQACAVFALAFLASGLLARRRRRRVAIFFDDARAEARAWPKAFRRKLGELDVRCVFALAVLLAIGVSLRLSYLNAPMAYDEAYSFNNFARRSWIEGIADYNSTNNHPLNTLLMHVAYRIGGQQEWVLRLPVLAAGVFLLLLTFPWASVRVGAGPALLTVALAAGSPMLIDYAVNARGYEFVAAAALAVDLCFLRLHRSSREGRLALTWLAAGLGAVLGVWSMPIMAYPLAGSIGWFAAAPYFDRRPCRGRLESLLLWTMLVWLAAAAGYTPAYIFRGFAATENPFVHALSWQDWSTGFPAAWRDAFLRWTAGPIPLPIWIALTVGGIVGWFERSRRESRTGAMGVAVAAPFLATAVLMTLHRVAPPPRLFLFLTPWCHLIVAVGLAVLIGKLQRFARWLNGDACLRLAAYAVAAASVLYAFDHPILREPHQRDFGVGSVEEAVQLVKREAAAEPGVRHRLLAPLPCDHPAIFYVAKLGAVLEINGVPQAGERVWLLCLPNEPPERTLANVVVQLADWNDRLRPWRKAAEFQELTIWRAQIFTAGVP